MPETVRPNLHAWWVLRVQVTHHRARLLILILFLERLVDGVPGADLSSIDRHLAALLIIVPLPFDMAGHPVALFDVRVVRDDPAEAAVDRHGAVVRITDRSALFAHDEDAEELVPFAQAYRKDAQFPANPLAGGAGFGATAGAGLLAFARLVSVAAGLLDLLLPNAVDQLAPVAVRLLDLLLPNTVDRLVARVHRARERRAESDGDDAEEEEPCEYIVLIHYTMFDCYAVWCL